ncbi:MAG: hypothetical protein ACTS5I_03980, partial [Rhodanobacter sp.]
LVSAFCVKSTRPLATVNRLLPGVSLAAMINADYTRLLAPYPTRAALAHDLFSPSHHSQKTLPTGRSTARVGMLRLENCVDEFIRRIPLFAGTTIIK